MSTHLSPLLPPPQTLPHLNPSISAHLPSPPSPPQSLPRSEGRGRRKVGTEVVVETGSSRPVSSLHSHEQVLASRTGERTVSCCERLSLGSSDASPLSQISHTCSVAPERTRASCPEHVSWDDSGARKSISDFHMRAIPPEKITVSSRDHL